MIPLIQKQNILIMHYREGKSQREIARITGVDRKTVGKYIKQYEQQRRELEERGHLEDPSILIQAIVESPKYTVGKRSKRKLTENVAEGTVLEIRFKDWFQHEFGCHLNDTVPYRRYAKRSFPPVRLGDVLAAYRLRTISTLPEKALAFFHKGDFALIFDIRDGFSVDSCRSTVRLDCSPCFP